MTSPETESDPPVPWYRPVLRIIERFNTRDNIILGSGKLVLNLDDILLRPFFARPSTLDGITVP